jgi:hypothetical protein
MTKSFTRRTMLLATGSGAAALAVPATGAAQAAAATPPASGQQPGGIALAAPPPGEIVPFRVHVPQSAIDDLRARLAATRLPDRETDAGWVQGAPLSRVRDLLGYWQDRYDWRRFERQLNSLPQFRTTIDGLGFYFIHVGSRHPGALPVILTHGWPGSVREFLDVIGPLTDPVAYGGTASDAFDVVIPALPGFSFSGKPAEPGWRLPRIAAAWNTLMTRLGYSRYVAQGGDWGAGVTT